MSFIITLYVREGIVMASDSRLTLSTIKEEEGKEVVHLAVGQSDTTYKTFLAPEGVGISTYGAADIEGVPISGYIESFINEHLALGKYEVDQVPRELVDYFSKSPGPPQMAFHVAGYKLVKNIAQQHVWSAVVKDEKTQRINESGHQGAIWGGEGDVLARLIKPVGTQAPNGEFEPISYYQVQWQFFTLQDAIDYAIYAVRATIDTMRFQPRPKSVGGPVDVLVLKPNEAFWVQRKALRGEQGAFT